ncbi:MAG: ATP-binding cassette domain-containing protein, partial [Propionibacteriaceae bacterium]|nr:ATP-binding cassette domain-containing protein [Propionibacteriaceae bacterium]
MSATTTPTLELRGVHVIHTTRTGGLFRPGTVHAVNDVDFTVSRGETVGIVGESGCGKSTLARVLVGLQKPSRGEVLFRGEPLRFGAGFRRTLGRAVSVVFQDPATALNPRMPVRDQLLDPLVVHRIGTPAEREQRVRHLLELVGLPAS